MADLGTRDVTEADCAAWHGERVVFGPTKEGVGRQLPVVVNETGIRVPFVLDEQSLMDLATGKTLWLVIHGHGMPAVALTTEPDPNW